MCYKKNYVGTFFFWLSFSFMGVALLLFCCGGVTFHIFIIHSNLPSHASNMSVFEKHPHWDRVKYFFRTPEGGLF
jgi:hypothetical protein